MGLGGGVGRSGKGSRELGAGRKGGEGQVGVYCVLSKANKR